METKFKPVKIYIELKLDDRASRDALETKISSFVSSQDAGSTYRNQYREDSTDQNIPFWFRTEMSIVVAAIGDVATLRTAIMGNIDTFGTVTSYQFDFEEVKDNEVVDPEEPLDP